MKPKVSVVIPSYNHGKFIKNAVNSVLNQTYKNFELIIIDDNSTDNSRKVINSFKDKRIRKYYNSNNEGAVATLNQLIDLANGEYIALLNSDDMWSNDKLEKQIKILEEKKEYSACFTWANFIDEKGNNIYKSDDLALDLFQKNNMTQAQWFRYFFDNGNCLCHPSMLIRKEVYTVIGKYNHIFKQLPDFDFWIRFIKKYKFYVINENLTKFRILKEFGENSSNLNEQNKNIMNYEMFIIKNSFFDNCDDKLFFEAFKDKIIRKNSIRDKNMLDFEKAFILYQSRYYKQIGRFIGYKKLGDILSDNCKANFIQEEYDFPIKDYYKLAQNIVPLDIQYFEQQIVEKIPNSYIESRAYRWSQKMYASKLYKFIYRIRVKIKNKKGKNFRRLK